MEDVRSPLDQIIAIAQQQLLLSTGHYERRLFERSMPDTDDIDYVLLRDEPKIIEEEYHRNSYTYLIWGIMGSRCIAHVLLSEPPDCQIITAYWPDIQPEKWRDASYIERV